MSHLAVPPALVRERLDDLTGGRVDDLRQFAVTVGDGAPVDLADLEQAADAIRDALDRRRDGGNPDLDVDQFEGLSHAFEQAGHADELRRRMEQSAFGRVLGAEA